MITVLMDTNLHACCCCFVWVFLFFLFGVFFCGCCSDRRQTKEGNAQSSDIRISIKRKHLKFSSFFIRNDKDRIR